MTGSVHIRNKTWSIKLSYKDNTGKWKSKWVVTKHPNKGNKKKAEAEIPALIEQYQYLENGDVDGSRVLFVDSAKQWLASKQGKVRKSTYEGLKIYVNKHIIPYFEPLKLTLDKITPKHIRDYYEHKFRNGRKDGKGGLNVQSIHKHGMVLKQIFTDAVITEQMMRNPAAGVPLPKQEQKDRAVYLTADEANTLLAAFKGHALQVMVYLTLYCGLRRSEVLGLRWQSVNLEKKTIKIEHTVVQNVKIEREDVTKSKTSAGTLQLSPELNDLLIALKVQQDENRRKFGDAYIDSDYIFVWQDGKLYRPDYITREFQKVLKKHGLPPMRFHDLRHSAASIIYDMGGDIKAVQEYLRHADIETTGNIYTRITAQRKQIFAEGLGKVLTIQT